MDRENKKIKKFLKYAIIFIIILGLLLTFSNLKKFKQQLLTMNITNFSLTIACTFIVYILEGIFIFFSLKVFNEKIPLFISLKYSLIINSFGYLVSLGGLTPFATQIYILDHHNITIKKATLTRVLQVIFFNFLFDILLIAGFVYILIYHKTQEFNLAVVIAPVSFFFLLITCFYCAIFWKSFRLVSTKIFFTVLNTILRLFSKKVKLDPSWALNLFDDFNEGFMSLIIMPHYLITIIGITIVDWIFWLSVMYFSFLTVNYPIKIGFMFIGFSIGQIIGILSMLPGGVGTLEGSMSLVYVALGVPMETALGAVILYRICFYIIPFFLSLPFYFSLKHKKEK